MNQIQEKKQKTNENPLSLNYLCIFFVLFFIQLGIEKPSSHPVNSLNDPILHNVIRRESSVTL